MGRHELVSYYCGYDYRDGIYGNFLIAQTLTSP